MFISYTREALRVVLSSIPTRPLCSKLWRCMTELRIVRRKPTRRGHRDGQPKQRPISVCMGRGRHGELINPILAGSYSINVTKSHEELHLHNSVLSTLLIQADTFSRRKTNTPYIIDVFQHNGACNNIQSGKATAKLSKLMLANVMSLDPKIDEVREYISRNGITLALITGTWLKESVSDGVVDIPDFTVLRRDRVNEDHGGVCAYIKDGACKYKQ